MTINGTNFIGTTSVSFGNGITIVSFNVINSTTITVSIAVSDNAAVGYRDVSVTTPAGTATLTNGFYVNELVLTTTGQLVRYVVPLVLIAIVLVFLITLIATGSLAYALITGAIASVIGVGVLAIVLDLTTLVN